MEVFGTIRIMIMSLLLQREHSLFRLMIVDSNRAPLVGLPVGRPVGWGHEGACHPHKIVSTPTKVPEGATRWQRGKAKQYPTDIWRCSADGKLERIAMSIIWKEYKKLTCDIFALTFSHQNKPPMAQQMSKNRQHLNYKQCSMSLRRFGDMALMSLTLDKTIPTR
jgi:hypothetical protein